MGTLSPDEIAMLAMDERYQALDAVAARDQALFALLIAEHPDATGPAGMTAMMQTAIRFNARWAHELPKQWEMLQADRAGDLSEFTAEANRAFRIDRLRAEAHAAANTRQEQVA